MYLTMTVRIHCGKRTKPSVTVEGNSVNDRTIKLQNDNELKESDLAEYIRTCTQNALDKTNDL